MRIRFITRGGSGWGMGHLHRVSWLATEILPLAPEHTRIEVACLDDPAARQFWAEVEGSVQFETEPEVLSQGLEAGDTVVFDWLDSPPGRIRELAASGVRCVCLDEYGPAQREADLVLNCLLSQLPWDERQVGRAQVLSGAELLQLPPAAFRLRGMGISTTRAFQSGPASIDLPTPPAGPVRSVIVSFGGTAQAGITRLALDALRQLEFDGKVILIPAPEPQPEPYGLDLDCHPAGEVFHDLLGASDLAILGGGLSLYEALFFGVPSLAVAVPSSTPGRESHQAETTAKLARAGACIDMGPAAELRAVTLADSIELLLVNEARRQELSRAGSSLLDGHGLARTLHYILHPGA